MSVDNQPTDGLHCFVLGKCERQQRDEELERWIAHFGAKGVPFWVLDCDGRAADSNIGPHRRLYKHTTRIRGNQIVPCCAGFNEEAEGRNLDRERWLAGFLTWEVYRQRRDAKLRRKILPAASAAAGW